MIKLRRYLAYYKKECIIGPLCKLFEAILELLVPLVMAGIIDNGVRNGDTAYIWRMGGLLVILATVGLCSALVCQYLASKASQGVGTRLRRDLFLHINRLSHAELDRLGTPSLITRITYDTNQVQQSVAMAIRLLTRAPFIVIGSMVMAMTINLEMSIIFFIAAILIAVTLYLIMTKSIPIFEKMQKKLDKISLICRENLSGNRVIRAFSKQKNEKKRIDDSTEDLAKTSIRVSILSALLSPVTYIITNAAIILIIWFGAQNVNAGSGMLSGDIIALVNYMAQILVELIKMANLIITITKAVACGNRVASVLDLEPGQENGTRTAADLKGQVEFRDVTARYDGAGNPSLEHISFTAQPGQTVGIIGGTGSGKTTLVNLIPRLYDAADGKVLLDGVETEAYDLTSLRQAIGVVPQKAVLFKGTIRQNLLWGNASATDSDLWEALTVAQAKEVVEGKENGLDAPVEQGGVNFSGGQRQRLTIARALVRKPRVLILDDSASALDYATDAGLRMAIRRMDDPPTTFIVSQRAASVRYADEILVLDDGVLAGKGTHDELLESCPVYQEIYYSQFPKEAVQNG